MNDEWIESSPGRDLGVLTEEKMHETGMWTQFKASCILGFIKRSVAEWPAGQGKKFYPSTPFRWDIIWTTEFSSEAPSIWHTWTCPSRPRGGPERWSGARAPPLWGQAWESWGCSAQSSREILLQPSSTWRRHTSRPTGMMGRDFLSGSVLIRKNGLNSKPANLDWLLGINSLLWGWWGTRTRCWQLLMPSSPWKCSWSGCEQADQVEGVLAHSKDLEPDDRQGHFHSILRSDCMIVSTVFCLLVWIFSSWMPQMLIQSGDDFGKT